MAYPRVIIVDRKTKEIVKEFTLIGLTKQKDIDSRIEEIESELDFEDFYTVLDV